MFPEDKVNSEGHAKAQLSDLTGKNSVGRVVSILYIIRNPCGNSFALNLPS